MVKKQFIIKYLILFLLVFEVYTVEVSTEIILNLLVL